MEADKNGAGESLAMRVARWFVPFERTPVGLVPDEDFCAHKWRYANRVAMGAVVSIAAVEIAKYSGFVVLHYVLMVPMGAVAILFGMWLSFSVSCGRG